MACTSQSAVEYIRSSRTHLVGGLQNLSVIVENLYQQGVFTEEEVSKIQTEKDDFDKTRAILDSVTNKGEAACYELLKIIDISRKRTLKKSDRSKFDLHHWISCFSFKDDEEMDINYSKGSGPCHRYQEKLKKKACKLSEDVWKQSKEFLCLPNDKYSDQFYTPLVLDAHENTPSERMTFKSKKCKKPRRKKMKTYIPVDKQEISVNDLLKTGENKILLIGKPGVGKTTVACQMLNIWGGSDNKDLDYMFYFDTRKITNHMSLEDLLFNTFSEPDEGKEEVLEDIKRNSEHITIIFDGLTDLSSSVIERLVEGDLLPDAKIVITCKQGDFLSDWASLRVEVKGFSTKSIKAYLAKMLDSEQLSTIENNLELFSLCHVPVYALMVVACFSFTNPMAPQKTCTVTEICINILRGCLQKHSGKAIPKNKLNNYIRDHCTETIFALAMAAFQGTQGKSVNLPALSCEESCVRSAFLKTLDIQVEPTVWETHSAFLHYTIQEFFAALWFLKNPDKITDLLQLCCPEEMKCVIPFLCGLCSTKNLAILECLSPVQQVKDISKTFILDVVNTFLSSPLTEDQSDTDDSNILFLCQCLYESQSTEACLHFLDKLEYCLDLSDETLDPHHYCAVSYVISQSKERKIKLRLTDTVSEQGLRLILGCLENIHGCDTLQSQLWKAFLLSEEKLDYRVLLGLGGNELHLPVCGGKRVFERAVEIMQNSPEKVNLCILWNRKTSACPELRQTLLESLAHINTLRFRDTSRGEDSQIQGHFSGLQEGEVKQLLLDLCLEAAIDKREVFRSTVNELLSLFSVYNMTHDILFDLLKPHKPPAPTVWSIDPVWCIDLSGRKTSILLECLKLQPEKKPVELRSWPDEESELRIFLQCLPYISQLRFTSQNQTGHRCLMNLCVQAALNERLNTQTTIEEVFSLSEYCHHKCDFLLDLYSHSKDYETQTLKSVLPALQPVFLVTPEVWSIDLSERKASILLECLKLQPEKKTVELKGWSNDESEVRVFLQCLPYISHLSYFSVSGQEPSKFLGKLICEAAEREEETGEKILELLSSVCNYRTFPLIWDSLKYQCDVLLDLYSYVKNYETQTGRSVLPALQQVYQSLPAVWYIDLSERKASVLLEVLKLQQVKKPVWMTSWSDEESELRIFLQCLPYISQLSVAGREQFKFLGKLICEAAEREEETGEKIVELLSSVFNYKHMFDLYGTWGNKKYQCDVLLDLCSYVKNYETQTGRSVLPALRPVYQSLPAVWSIDLSERKVSLLLEVLKLQPEKKPVELTGWSDEESEVRIFLQCLPYISQLSFYSEMNARLGHITDATHCVAGREQFTFLGKLICEAAEREEETGEKILELLSSVFNYKHMFDLYGTMGNKYQCDVLLDLCSYVKNYETQTGRSVLPALQPVYQSVPGVWSIDLSERKVSLLLEVLKLQPEKKPVEMTGWSDEESEVRIFLQCLPYISQLRFTCQNQTGHRFLMNLCVQAALHERLNTQTIEEVFSLSDYWHHKWDFLLDLCSHVKDYETQTGRSVLPALKPVYLAAPKVRTIDLSERKVSVLLEVLKLQPEKKPVELSGWSEEESEVRIFLQCLPYISQLRFTCQNQTGHRFLMNLCVQAALHERLCTQTIQEVFSLSDYWHHKWDFLLDLCSHVKDYETQTGRSVLPALKPVYLAAPKVRTIDLSERKASVLLEVLKLQPEKKPVELSGWSREKSEVRIFLQCLPYISQLRFADKQPMLNPTKFLGKLICEAAEQEEETGEKILELLSSICNYQTFPLINWHDVNNTEYQCGLLLDLYSYVKSYETQTSRRVLPALQPAYQTVPAVWSIDLSKRKVSLLLEVLKLQQVKKPVELINLPNEESAVKIFLQCLPYISQLSFTDRGESDMSEEAKFLGELFCEAAEREGKNEEKILELLYHVCNYESFPVINWDDDVDPMKPQCYLLLELYSYVKNFENQTGRSVLPALKPVYQSPPAVWSIDLSKKDVCHLEEVLKFQPEKKPVKLTGWSQGEDDEIEVRIFLQCLPHISQLRCDDPGFFQHTCKSITVKSREEVEQLVSLLRLLDFNLVLTGELWTNTCKSVGKVLQLCGSEVDLVLTPSKISLKGVSLLFKDVAQIQRLGLSESMILLLFRSVRTGRLKSMSLIEELSLLKTTPQSDRLLSRVVSNVASLLRLWTVRCLDMTKSSIQSYFLPLLTHHDQLTIKLCPEVLQKLAGVVFTAQDDDLTKYFLEKVGGDLTSCSLDWEVLLYLLQQSSAQMFTVDLRKKRIPERSITGLVPFLDRFVFKRPSPSFTLCAIRETYKCRSSDFVLRLLRSLDYVINLNNTELNTVDCDALLFTLKHCDKMTQLSLLWTSIPPEAMENIMFSMDKVSHLSVDRSLQLTFLHCCTTCQTQQGAAAARLLRALQYRLDLSCSSSVDLSEQQQVEALSLTVTHCRDISTVLTHSSSQDTQLILSDCEVEDSGLDLLFPVLNRVHLRCSKSLLLQLLSLVSEGSERNTVMRAGSLAGALGGELDLSETRLDQKACRCLALVLEHSEGLTELDLSHCQLTDQLLETLIPHLHKIQVLDLSHNNLTDALTDRLLQLLSINTSIQTVRLFNNCFEDRTPFLEDKHFEIW